MHKPPVQSLVINRVCFTVDQLVEFKAGFRSRWRPGYIEAIEEHRVKVRAADGRRERVTIILGGEGRRGKIRDLASRGCLAVRAERRRGAAIDAAYLPSPQGAAGALPAIRAIVGGSPRAVPRPAPPARSPRFLAFVRSQPCAGCPAPAPSDPHHAGEPKDKAVGRKVSDHLCVPLCRECHEWITLTGALPRLTREETELQLLRVKVALLMRWAALLEQEAAHTEAGALVVPLSGEVAA